MAVGETRIGKITYDYADGTYEIDEQRRNAAGNAWEDCPAGAGVVGGVVTDINASITGAVDDLIVFWKAHGLATKSLYACDLQDAGLPESPASGSVVYWNGSTWVAVTPSNDEGIKWVGGVPAATAWPGGSGMADTIVHTIKVNTGIPIAGTTEYTIAATDLRGEYIRVEMAYRVNASSDNGWTSFDYGGNNFHRKWKIEAAPAADLNMGASPAPALELNIDKDDGYPKWAWTSHGTIRWGSCRILVYSTVPDYEAT